jgi:hypothetical protein
LTGIETPTEVCRTRISDIRGRENDVEALFHTSDGNKFVALIEDKVKEKFQPDEMQDYLRLAEQTRPRAKKIRAGHRRLNLRQIFSG